jgi:hypothetical protein
MTFRQNLIQHAEKSEVYRKCQRRILQLSESCLRALVALFIHVTY